MIRIVSSVLVLQLGYALLSGVNGQTYTGPIPKPSSGYGQDGTYTVEKVTFLYTPTFITLTGSNSKTTN